MKLFAIHEKKQVNSIDCILLGLCLQGKWTVFSWLFLSRNKYFCSNNGTRLLHREMQKVFNAKGFTGPLANFFRDNSNPENSNFW